MKNIIILFADGAAATQMEFGRYSSELLRGQPFAVTSEVMRHGTLGLMSTLSNNAYVTDSAAAAYCGWRAERRRSSSPVRSPGATPCGPAGRRARRRVSNPSGSSLARKSLYRSVVA